MGKRVRHLDRARYGILGVVGAIGASLIAAAPAKADTVINWTAGSDFEDATQTFSGVYASTFDWTGDGYMHSHNGGTVNGTIELNIDNTWTTVANYSTTSSSPGFQLSSLPVINFAAGTVTGIRISSAPDQFNSYHSMGGDQFTLGTGSAVPLPGVALAGTALMSAIGGKRLRRLRRD